MVQRWCDILKCQRTPETPEVLRIVCSEALCAAGVPLIDSLREHSSFCVIMMKYVGDLIMLHSLRIFVKILTLYCFLWFRLINTGLYLLQDQSQQVRQKAAQFASMLHHSRQGNHQRSVCIMQINQSLLLLLDLLLEECWDTPGTLELLLSHLPQADLRSVLRDALAAKR